MSTFTSFHSKNHLDQYPLFRVELADSLNTTISINNVDTKKDAETRQVSIFELEEGNWYVKT
jgi:hypothetical protein